VCFASCRQYFENETDLGLDLYLFQMFSVPCAASACLASAPDGFDDLNLAESRLSKSVILVYLL